MEQLQCRLYVFRELLCWQNFGTDDCCCISINVLLSDLWCLWDDNRICGRMDLPGPCVFNMLKFPFKTHSVWIYFQRQWESIWFYLQVHADVPYLKKLVMNPLHLWLKHLNVSILMQVQGYDIKSYSWLSRQKKSGPRLHTLYVAHSMSQTAGVFLSRASPSFFPKRARKSKANASLVWIKWENYGIQPFFRTDVWVSWASDSSCLLTEVYSIF